MFIDGEDVTYRFKDAKLELLDLEELKNLHNSDTSEILSYSNKLDKLKHVVKLAQSYGKDYKSLLNAFKNNYKLPPPLVIRDTKDQLYLMAGNTRLMSNTAYGRKIPLKVIEYDVERKFREARLYQVAPISTNLILSYLAEHVLGMPRSY